MLSFSCRAGGAREGQDQHRVCRDQTSESSAQDSSDADGGPLCFCPVLPANQRAQCHEKVILLSSAALRIKRDPGTERSAAFAVINQGSTFAIFF